MSRFSFLFPWRREIAPTPELPAGQRIYAVGDIHGRLDCLLMMDNEIRRDMQRHPPKGEAVVIFLGDYIDRGPDSKAVINVLQCRRFAGLPARFLLGNHEDAMLRFLENPQIGDAWFTYGGMATLASYGVKPAGEESADRLTRLSLGLVEVLPPKHLEFLRGLELAIQFGGYLFVHAGVRPGRELEAQRREDLLTIRDAFFSAAKLPWRVVHGHTVVERPIVSRNRISLDTGAYASGRLTAARLEGDVVELLTATPAAS